MLHYYFLVIYCGMLDTSPLDVVVAPPTIRKNVTL